jgi:O-antigen/teichoic acid export membrane protein
LPQATCYMVSKTPADARRILGTGSIGSFAVSAAIGGIGVLASPLITSNSESVRYLRVLFALLPVYTIPIVWIATLQAVRIQHWNFARMVQPAVYFAGIATYTLSGTLTVGKGVAALIVSLVVQLIVGGALVWREVGPPGAPSVALWRPLFAYGIKSTASLGPYLVNYRLDQLVLSVMVPAAALGNYTVAVSVSVLATPIAFAFGYVAFPRIAAARSRAEARKVERTAILGSVIVATAVLVPMGLLARWVIPLVFGSGFDRAVIALWLLIPGTIAFSANQVAEDILRGRGRPLAPAIAEGVGVVLTVGLLLVLVPRLGIYGAAITSAFVYAGVAAILTQMLRKHPEDAVPAETGQSFEVAGSNA